MKLTCQKLVPLENGVVRVKLNGGTLISDDYEAKLELLIRGDMADLARTFAQGREIEFDEVGSDRGTYVEHAVEPDSTLRNEVVHLRRLYAEALDRAELAEQQVRVLSDANATLSADLAVVRAAQTNVVTNVFNEAPETEPASDETKPVEGETKPDQAETPE